MNTRKFCLTCQMVTDWDEPYHGASGCLRCGSNTLNQMLSSGQQLLLETRGRHYNSCQKVRPNGISICILTYNVPFYNKLAIQQIRKLTRCVEYEILVYDNGSPEDTKEWLKGQRDVVYHEGSGNVLRHGQALDLLAKEAKYDVMCALCSDAFPVSPEWILPALYLYGDTVISGVNRESKREGRILGDYPCPSYFFGLTDWVRGHSFVDDWPRADTGELLGQACLDEGKQMKLWDRIMVDFDGMFRPKPCDYAGLVWHTWWSGRTQTIPSLTGNEFETGYHEFVINMLRERFKLDF